MLGVDLGTSSCKSVLVDEEGRVAGAASGRYLTYSPKPGWAEQNPEEWYSAFTRSIKRLVRITRARPSQISSLCIDGMLSSPVYLDSSGQTIRSTIIWMDQRSADQVSMLEEKIGKDTFFRETYNPVTATLALPKMLWVKQNQPRVWKKTFRILFPKDYLRFKVTGELVTDFSEASSILVFNRDRNDWSEEILQVTGIDREKLPEVLPSAKVISELTRKKAREIGLEEGIPVVVGCVDAAADCLSSGSVEPGDCQVRLGTNGAFHMITGKATGDSCGRVFSFYHCLPERHILETFTPSGIAHKWFIDTFFDTKSGKTGHPRDAYRAMEELAKRSSLGSNGLIFHPYVMGEHSPSRSTHLKGAFLHIGAHNRKADFSRAVFEGMAFSLYECLMVLKEMEPSIKSIRLAGGGAKSAFWRSLITDVLGVRTETTAVEDASFGAAILGGIGAGVFKSHREAVRSCVKVTNTIDADTIRHKEYARLYKVHVELREAIQEQYRQIDEESGGSDLLLRGSVQSIDSS
jgi:xylulokinase